MRRFVARNEIKRAEPSQGFLCNVGLQKSLFLSEEGQYLYGFLESDCQQHFFVAGELEGFQSALLGFGLLDGF
jgi:hypothetical protein